MFAKEELGLSLTNRAKSTACIPSTLSTRTRWARGGELVTSARAVAHRIAVPMNRPRVIRAIPYIWVLNDGTFHGIGKFGPRSKRALGGRLFPRPWLGQNQALQAGGAFSAAASAASLMTGAM